MKLSRIESVTRAIFSPATDAPTTALRTTTLRTTVLRMTALRTTVLVMIVLLAAGALLCSMPRLGRAQSAAVGLFEQANQAYEEGRYEEAGRFYEEILASGTMHGAVLYNLGNAYFKMNRLGEAILAYERAQLLLPRDEDVAANLLLARELTVDKIAQEDPPLPVRWLTYPARALNINELTWVSFILYLLTTSLVVIGIWTRPVRWRKKVLVSALIAGVLLVVAGSSLAGKIYRQTSAGKAVILAAAVDARSGPGDDYTRIFTAHEGTAVRVRQRREGWYLIALPNGLGGWIPDETAEFISWQEPFMKGGKDAEVPFGIGPGPDGPGRDDRSGL